jgi:hypothetical protein
MGKNREYLNALPHPPEKLKLSATPISEIGSSGNRFYKSEPPHQEHWASQGQKLRFR